MKKFLLLFLVVLFVFTSCDNSVRPIRFAFGESGSGTESQDQNRPEPGNPSQPDNEDEDTEEVNNATPLTIKFTAEGGGTITIKNVPESGMKYSRDNGTTKEAITAENNNITAKKGEKIRLYANGTGNYEKTFPLPGGELHYLEITCDNECLVYGNVMSLLCDPKEDTNCENFKDNLEIKDQIALKSLFLNNKGITSAKKLLLPAKTLKKQCYSNMFMGCENLKYAPESLPAENLTGGTSCYSGMFNGCKNLTDPPKLSATTLATSCYSNMFAECASLETAPSLPAEKLETSCYYDMFLGCTSLTSAPDLNAQTLAPRCYATMFNGCGLKSAPALPATKLEEGCYSGMFKDCKGLTEVSEELLSSVKTLAPECYAAMFDGCINLKKAPKLPATELTEGCYSGMFMGCTGLNEVPEGLLSVTTLAKECYAAMFDGCTGLTKAPELPATELAEGCYAGMFKGCTGLTDAPELKATTLVTNCYNQMFEGCSNLNAIICLATNTSASKATEDWLKDVSSQGTFTKAKSSSWTNGASGIPTGWTVKEQ